MTTTANDILQALERHPWLTRDEVIPGLVLDDELMRQVEAAMQWCRHPPRGGCTLLCRAGAYTAKHQAEKQVGRYISMTAMILGAILAGWRPVNSMTWSRDPVFRRA